MHSIIQNNRQQIIQLCIQHHVKTLYAFGSVVRDDFNTESDIDFLVEYNDTISDLAVRIENEDDLKKKLELLLQKEVDMIRYSLITNKYLKYFINSEKKLIYAEA